MQTATEYTVITSGLDKFVDPGVNINDGSTSDTIKGTVSAVSGVEGLYKVHIKSTIRLWRDIC